MVIPRIIPCLLLKSRGLVKSVRFGETTYLGDPVNIVRIFDDKFVDEVILLDILASREERPPHFDFIREIAEECFIPLTYGGGIASREDAGRLFGLGVERICLNSAAVRRPALIRELSESFGSQSIVVAMDVRRDWLGRYRLAPCGVPAVADPGDVVEYARRCEGLGAGELLVSAIDRDGTSHGYDLDLLGRVSTAVGIPVIAAGGAGNLEHMRDAIALGGASAAAAGTLFVLTGRHRAVLIQYPSRAEIRRVFGPPPEAFGESGLQADAAR